MFEQHAHGDFSVDVTGCNHCGPNHESPKHFSYDVEMHFPLATALDEQGFLLDNLCFQEYFDSLRTIDYSCEFIARKAAEHFWLASGSRCSYVAVGIRGTHNTRVCFILRCSPAELAARVKLHAARHHLARAAGATGGL